MVVVLIVAVIVVVKKRRASVGFEPKEVEKHNTMDAIAL